MKQRIRLNESQLRNIVRQSVNRMLNESNNDETWYVQETIGGWRQKAVFSGSYQECLDYLSDTYINGSVALVPESEYEVDYLDNDDDNYVDMTNEPHEKRERFIVSKDGKTKKLYR